MTKENFIFLPFWVETAMARNGLALEACLDYGQVRQILSLEDMSGLLALQDISVVTREDGGSSRTLLTNWYESAKGAHLIELNSSIIPLARSNELSQEIIKRLSVDHALAQPTNSVTNTLESTFYKIVDINRGVAVLVMYEGFPLFISKPENEFKVTVEQLKIFYMYLKVHQVSALPLFRRYLSLLNFKFSSSKLAPVN